MNKKYYTNERNIQMIISLLKEHNIKKIIASPGTTNISFVGSIQNDPYFEIYSSVDERSAAYIACGLAAESGEPVVLTCTGATASRNYIPGMTEAYYRKLPILALTATQHSGRIGQNIAQVIDRRVQQNDTVKLNVEIPIIHTKEDEENCSVLLNNAMLELRHNGGGPVLINYETTYSNDFSVKELPPVHTIRRICYKDELPNINEKNVAIFVGAHLKWSDNLTNEVDEFCQKYNGVVICDQTSNYTGKYGISGALLCTQQSYIFSGKNFDLLIDIGDMSGAYFNVNAKNVWRVNPDGQIRHRANKLDYVFEMEELDFFKKYNNLKSKESNTTNYDLWFNEDKKIRKKIDLNTLPFSNAWIAQYLSNKLPKNSTIYLGILNTLRCWNFTELLKNNYILCNTGGFGIDGNVSSTIGTSLNNINKLSFGFIGDLAFFYDMNSIGNRHVRENIRLLLVNNGKGTEFRNFNHRAEITFGEEADDFMAAAGHYGNQSKEIVKNYAENLGFEYISAANKEEFIKNSEIFVNEKITKKPILFEVFTNYQDESDAIKYMMNLQANGTGTAKKIVKNVLGKKGTEKLKQIIKR